MAEKRSLDPSEDPSEETSKKQKIEKEPASGLNEATVETENDKTTEKAVEEKPAVKRNSETDQFSKIRTGKLSFKKKNSKTEAKPITETERLDQRCKKKHDRLCNY